MDDIRLADDLARDLDAAFERLVLAHADRCHAIALRLMADPHDAEEVAQDALVRAYRALAGYPPGRVRQLRLRPWLATIVVNVARNRRRRRAFPTRPLDPLVDAGHEPAAGDSTDPAVLVARAASTSTLVAALDRLPDRYRVPIVLRHVDDLSYAELAEALGRPEGTLKAQVHRGLALLRATLDADAQELTA